MSARGVGVVAGALAGTMVLAGCMAETPHERASAQGVETTTLARSLNAAGFDIFRAAGDAPNLSISPVSIGIAFGMVKTGANRPVSAALDEVFEYPDSDAVLLREFNALDLATSSEPGEGAENVEGETIDLPIVRIANRAYLDEDFTPRDDYLVKIGTYFGADAVSAPLRKNPERSRELINGWVSDRTQGLVKNIMPEDQPTPLTQMVLVNTVYMKAQWFSPFDATLTREDPFHVEPGRDVTATFMHAALDASYVDDEGFAAVVLPYVGELEMVLIVPDEGEFDEIQGGLSQGFLDDLDASAREGHVAISLPKFDTESKTNLRGVIEGGLGVDGLFGVVGLDGIAPDLQVDAASHATHVIVDEEGTEAGAATVVDIAATGMPVYDNEIYADRPFLYVIRDTETGAVLFVGRYSDPSVQ